MIQECPRCGSREVETMDAEPNANNMGIYIWFNHCEDCNHDSEVRRTKREAAELWEVV